MPPPYPLSIPLAKVWFKEELKRLRACYHNHWGPDELRDHLDKNTLEAGVQHVWTCSPNDDEQLRMQLYYWTEDEILKHRNALGDVRGGVAAEQLASRLKEALEEHRWAFSSNKSFDAFVRYMARPFPSESEFELNLQRARDLNKAARELRAGQGVEERGYAYLEYTDTGIEVREERPERAWGLMFCFASQMGWALQSAFWRGQLAPAASLPRAAGELSSTTTLEIQLDGDGFSADGNQDFTLFSFRVIDKERAVFSRGCSREIAETVAFSSEASCRALSRSRLDYWGTVQDEVFELPNGSRLKFEVTGLNSDHKFFGLELSLSRSCNCPHCSLSRDRFSASSLCYLREGCPESDSLQRRAVLYLHTLELLMTAIKVEETRMRRAISDSRLDKLHTLICSAFGQKAFPNLFHLNETAIAELRIMYVSSSIDTPDDAGVRFSDLLDLARRVQLLEDERSRIPNYLDADLAVKGFSLKGIRCLVATLHATKDLMRSILIDGICRSVPRRAQGALQRKLIDVVSPSRKHGFFDHWSGNAHQRVHE